MKKTIILLLVAIIFSGTKVFAEIDYSKEKASKTVLGDCNSSDSKKRFISKIYSDVNCDGKYDNVVITDCNGATKAKPYKETVKNGQTTPQYDWDIEVDTVDHLLLNHFSNLEGTDYSETWGIYNSIGTLMGYEIKSLGCDYFILIVL